MNRSVCGTVIMALSLVALAGCGKEAGRLPFAGEGSGSATMALQAGDVDFWSDLEIEYEGDAILAYEIELEQGGATVAKARCNPLGRMSTKIMWTETNLGNSHTRTGNGKMDCSVKLPTAGSTTVKVTLAYSKKPATGKIKKIDLVVKQ